MPAQDPAFRHNDVHGDIVGLRVKLLELAEIKANSDGHRSWSSCSERAIEVTSSVSHSVEAERSNKGGNPQRPGQPCWASPALEYPRRRASLVRPNATASTPGAAALRSPPAMPVQLRI